MRTTHNWITSIVYENTVLDGASVRVHGLPFSRSFPPDRAVIVLVTNVHTEYHTPLWIVILIFDLNFRRFYIPAVFRYAISRMLLLGAIHVAAHNAGKSTWFEIQNGRFSAQLLHVYGLGWRKCAVLTKTNELQIDAISRAMDEEKQIS